MEDYYRLPDTRQLITTENRLRLIQKYEDYRLPDTRQPITISIKQHVIKNKYII